MDTPEKSGEPKTEIRASFLILNFACSHEDITALVGVEPSETWHKGDLIGTSAARRRSKGWQLESQLPQTASLEQHASHLLDRLYPRATSVTSVEGYTARLFFAVYIYGFDRPPMMLPEHVIKRLAALKARLDIDIYNFEAE